MSKKFTDTNENWANRDFEKYLEELAKNSSTAGDLPPPAAAAAPVVEEEEEEEIVPPEDPGYNPDIAEFLKFKELVGDDESKLSDARAESRERVRDTNLAQAFGDLGAGLAGQKVDPAFYNSLRDQETQGLKGSESAVERNRKLVTDFMTNKRMTDIAKDNREARKEQNQFNKQLLSEAKKTKEEEKLAALEVPGFSRVGSVRQSPGEAEKARKAAGTMESLDQSLGRMKELVDKYGSFEVGGPGGAEMETLATTLKLQMKELAELGALSGPDMAILASQIADPSSWGSLFTRDSTRKTSLEATKRKLKQDFETSMTSKGYARRKPGWAS